MNALQVLTARAKWLRDEIDWEEGELNAMSGEFFFKRGSYAKTIRRMRAELARVEFILQFLAQ